MGKFEGIIAEASDAPAYFDKDSNIGDRVSGRVTAISMRQTRDFKTKEPETWKDGSPREQFVVVLDTRVDGGSNLNQFDGDDGKRSVYIKWWGTWRKAFAKAILSVAQEPEIGGSLSVAFTGLGEPDEGMSPAKLFEYVYAAPGTELPVAAGDGKKK